MSYAQPDDCDQHGFNRLLEDLGTIIEEVNKVLPHKSEQESAGQLLSFVVPIKDEQDTIQALCEGIAAHVPLGYEFEIILIDDGSQDGSWTVIEQLARTSSVRIRGIKFRHNSGKAAALAAGFRAAQGELVFSLDGDLQDDPQEIPRFLEKAAEGYDLVNGWKRVRHDPWHKVLPSRVFNVLASAAGGVWLHDHNCGFKCYRSAVIKQLKLHGELHRMIPSMAGMYGFRCTEIEVQHHPRRTGRSKYGIERFLRGFCDVLTIGFLRRFRQRPAHFFNAVAGVQLGIVAVLIAAGVCRSTAGSPDVNCLLLSGVFLAAATFTFLCGLLAEITIRGPLDVYHELPVDRDTANPVEHGSSPNFPTHQRPDATPPMHAATVTQRMLFNIGAEQHASAPLPQ